jgi:major membrane immunogen (membrane-anchored lipoprotein)
LYLFLLENDDIVNQKLDELKDRAYKTDNGKAWYDWQNQDGNFNKDFKSSFQSKYDNAIYAKEIYDKYADKIFDNSFLNSMQVETDAS